MKLKLRFLLASVSLLIVAFSAFTFITEYKSNKAIQILEEQRAQHTKVMANSPFKETLT
jgi:hypothetical protein